MAKRTMLALGLFALVALPAAAYARSQGGKLSLLPEAVVKKNSQTMSLLEGYLNINPTGPGSSELAIVDNTALSSESDETGVFVDAGKSGNGQISVYTVRSGDTLASVAKMFDVSTNTILWANDIKNGKVSVGQELVILPISGVRYTVKSGDTLQSIALKYKGDLNDILDYNGLSANSKIVVGDVIIIPDGEITAAQTSSIKSTVKSVTGVPSYSGYYRRPINGGVKTQGIHGHNAVDLASPIGTPIMAAADGKVIVSKTGGYNGGYGTYVVISHANGTQTVYGHMSVNKVSVGQTVKQGEVIGAIGMTGNTTGPHVHFEVRGAKNPF